MISKVYNRKKKRKLFCSRLTIIPPNQLLIIGNKYQVNYIESQLIQVV